MYKLQLLLIRVHTRSISVKYACAILQAIRYILQLRGTRTVCLLITLHLQYTLLNKDLFDLANACRNNMERSVFHDVIVSLHLKTNCLVKSRLEVRIIPGRSNQSILCRYGAKVAVVEAHNAPGGAAHHWSRGPFSFDSGAALFSGINPLTPEEAKGADLTTANPLSSVLAALGEQVPDVVDMPDSATCLIYPDGKQYRCQMGSKAFVDVVQERHGSEAARQWREFQAEVDRLCATAGAVAPAAVRLDDGTVSMTPTSVSLFNVIP